MVTSSTGQCKLLELNVKRTLFHSLDYFNSNEKEPTQAQNLYSIAVVLNNNVSFSRERKLLILI